MVNGEMGNATAGIPRLATPAGNPGGCSGMPGRPGNPEKKTGSPKSPFGDEIYLVAH